MELLKERERKGVCMSLYTHAVCKNQFLSSVCLLNITAGMLTDSQTHIHKHKYSCVTYIQQFTVLYMHVSMYMLLSLTTEWKLMFLNVKAPPILPSLMSNITCSAQDQLL